MALTGTRVTCQLFRAKITAGAAGEGFGSPVLGVMRCQEFEFWAVARGITGGPERPPVPPELFLWLIADS